MNVRKQSENQGGAKAMVELEPRQEDAEDQLPDLASYSVEDTAKITKIQANARGMSVRKQAESATKDPVLEAAEEQVAASDELPDLSSYSAEDAAKITRIQANARGMHVRKQ